jgi:copper chaperone CopZ
MDSTFRIDGMTCGGCAASVMSAVGRVPGVEVLAVDPVAGTARVRLGADADLVADIAAAVEAAGFTFVGAVPAAGRAP